METNGNETRKWKRAAQITLIALAVLGLAIVQIETRSSVLAEDNQTTFQSPADAGAALVQAARNDDEVALGQILGVNTKTLLGSGDKETDKTALKSFATKYDKMNRWLDMTDGTRVLYIGADNFAFPVPLAKNPSDRWHFDAVAGAEEIRARDIGRNELLTIDACAALTNAQRVYYANGGDSAEYAQRIISTAGKQDGLYWPVSEDQGISPLAELSDLPRSSLALLAPDQPLVLDGYKFRVLTAQGNDAPGGARDYIVNGKMSGGFALLATPLKYAQTGIMTFMTGPDGVVYERDLGPDTAKIAASIQQFNPTDDWSEVE
jgi:Protein of unknown function (DUF2950)